MQFNVFGPLTVSEGSDPIGIGGPKQRAVLAMLIAHAGTHVSVDAIIEAVWSDDRPGKVRRNVQVYVANLRSAMGDVIVKDGDGWRLTVDRADVDALAFEDLYESVRDAVETNPERASVALREALALWRGHPYADIEAHGALDGEIARLTELRTAVQAARVDADLAMGRDADLVGDIEALLVENPYRERFRAQHMLALYRAGRQTEALRSYEQIRTILVGELGVDPSPELQHLEQQILNQDDSLLFAGERFLAQDSSLSPASGDLTAGPPSEMPIQRTTFVGREGELAQGAELLEASRLLTLTGAPGSGKTRLAIRLAADHMDDFPHGSFFVPLAPITDPRLLESTVAGVLGLREVPGESTWERVGAFLQGREALLVLDNFEQIVLAAPRVGELLDMTSGLTIMVTSRSPLGISGEQEFPVPPLGVPFASDLPDLESLATYDAVALFVVRAGSADPSFELDTENAAAIAQITARLDGLPLAIELAAARVKLLTPRALLDRLDQRLTMLTRGPADVVDRHRTMRAAIDWSYGLLEPEEQALFRRLGMFQGGFTLVAATTVVDLPDLDILEGTESLLSGSLVYRLADTGEARFAMLAMVREFALEQLKSVDEYEEVGRRHARYFCQLAEATEPELTRETQREAIGLLSREVDNLRAALGFAVGVDEADLGLNLGSCIWRFWQSSGQLSEGRRWLDSLMVSQRASDPARARGLTGLAGLAYWQSDFEEAMSRYSEALDLYRAVGDRSNEAETLFSMSMAASWNENPDAGLQLAGEARSIFEALGTKEGIGKVSMAQAFALHRKGDYAAARPLWTAALDVSRELGDQHLAVTQLIPLAMYIYEDGDTREALRVALEAAHESIEAENVQLAVWILDFVAAFAADAAPEGAVRLAGAVEALRRKAGGGMLLAPLDLEDARSVATRTLSPERLGQAWAEGQAMTLDQAVECAQELEGLIANLSTS